jgi:hypothetical protein
VSWISLVHLWPIGLSSSWGRYGSQISQVRRRGAAHQRARTSRPRPAKTPRRRAPPSIRRARTRRAGPRPRCRGPATEWSEQRRSTAAVGGGVGSHGDGRIRKRTPAQPRTLSPGRVVPNPRCGHDPAPDRRRQRRRGHTDSERSSRLWQSSSGLPRVPRHRSDRAPIPSARAACNQVPVRRTVAPRARARSGQRRGLLSSRLRQERLSSVASADVDEGRSPGAFPRRARESHRLVGPPGPGVPRKRPVRS